MLIGVEGSHLAMPRGTGVATYAGEAIATLQAMDRQVDGSFGLPVPVASARREAAFLAAYRRSPTTAARLSLRRASVLRLIQHAGRHDARYPRAFASCPHREIRLKGDSRDRA